MFLVLCASEAIAQPWLCKRSQVPDLHDIGSDVVHCQVRLWHEARRFPGGFQNFHFREGTKITAAVLKSLLGPPLLLLITLG